MHWGRIYNVLLRIKVIYSITLHFSSFFISDILCCMISGFLCDVDENGARLGYYSASSGNLTTTHCVITEESAVSRHNTRVEALT